jgi:hypothetical protein
MDRGHLAHRCGDADNAILAVASYKFSVLIRWLRILSRGTGALAMTAA